MLVRFDVIGMVCSKTGLRCLIVVRAMDHLNDFTLSKVCAMAGCISLFDEAEAFVTLLFSSKF